MVALIMLVLTFTPARQLRSFSLPCICAAGAGSTSSEFKFSVLSFLHPRHLERGIVGG